MEALVDPLKSLGIEKRDFSLEINIDSESLVQLKDKQAQLCIARFFWGTHPLGNLTPTVWLASPNFTEQTKLSWDHKYEVYTISTTKEGEKVESRHPMGPGQYFIIEAIEFKCIGQVSHPKDYFTFSNCSGSSVQIGLSQKIFLDDNDMGHRPITLQTLGDKSKKSLILGENIYISFVPPEIVSGQRIMDSSEYQAISVGFKWPCCSRKIFYKTVAGKGLWCLKGDEEWAITWWENTEILEMLRGNIRQRQQ